MIIKQQGSILWLSVFKYKGALMIKGKKITDGVLSVKVGQKQVNKEVGVVVSKQYVAAKAEGVPLGDRNKEFDMGKRVKQVEKNEEAKEKTVKAETAKHNEDTLLMIQDNQDRRKRINQIKKDLKSVQKQPQSKSSHQKPEKKAIKEPEHSILFEKIQDEVIILDKKPLVNISNLQQEDEDENLLEQSMDEADEMQEMAREVFPQPIQESFDLLPLEECLPYETEEKTNINRFLKYEDQSKKAQKRQNDFSFNQNEAYMTQESSEPWSDLNMKLFEGEAQQLLNMDYLTV